MKGKACPMGLLLHAVYFVFILRISEAVNLNITVLSSVCDNVTFPNCKNFKIFICPDPPMLCKVQNPFDFGPCLTEKGFNGFDVNMGFGAGNTYVYSYKKMIATSDRLFVAVFKPTSNIYVDLPVTLLCQNIAMTPDQRITFQGNVGNYRLTILITEILVNSETTLSYQTTSAVSETIQEDTTVSVTTEDHSFSTKIMNIIAASGTQMTKEKNSKSTHGSSITTECIGYIIGGCGGLVIGLLIGAVVPWPCKKCRKTNAISPDGGNHVGSIDRDENIKSINNDDNQPIDDVASNPTDPIIRDGRNNRCSGINGNNNVIVGNDSENTAMNDDDGANNPVYGNPGGNHVMNVNISDNIVMVGDNSRNNILDGEVGGNIIMVASNDVFNDTDREERDNNDITVLDRVNSLITDINQMHSDAAIKNEAKRLIDGRIVQLQNSDREQKSLKSLKKLINKGLEPLPGNLD